MVLRPRGGAGVEELGSLLVLRPRVGAGVEELGSSVCLRCEWLGVDVNCCKVIY